MEIVTKIAPLALALIMLGLGLGLTVDDFLRVAKIPRDFLVGFLCQVILLPIIAFILIKIMVQVCTEDFIFKAMKMHAMYLLLGQSLLMI